MCNPLCATARRMAELEAENGRLRVALMLIAECDAWTSRGALVKIAKTALAPTEARDAR